MSSSVNNEHIEENGISSDKKSPEATTEQNSQEETPPATNPTENDCPDEDLERMKGDAIGSTLYSERFVLNTLLKLEKLNTDLQEEEEEEIERDLCSLWDMTIDEDVVNYLLEQDVLEIFLNTIGETEDKRLTEILVGIMANMCSICKNARQKILQLQDEVPIILDLLACTDSLTLIQLMRLIAVVFIKLEDVQHTDKWYKNIIKDECFLEKFCFILKYSESKELKLQTMEALNAILAKLSLMNDNAAKEQNDNANYPKFEETFVQNIIVNASIDCFNSLVDDSAPNNYDVYEDSHAGENVLKVKQTFCNIHSILSQYEELSQTAYASSNDDILKCFLVILKPLLDDSCELESWQDNEENCLITLNDVIRVLPHPCNEEILNLLINLWRKADTNQDSTKNTTADTNDFESDSEKQFDFSFLILNSIEYLIYKADVKLLQNIINANSVRKYYATLLDFLKNSSSKTQSLQKCLEKIELCYKNLK